MDAKEIIAKFKLEKHPEGGYFKEVYRSEGIISEDNLPNNIDGKRNYSTSIYFLLTSHDFSAFHKINQDEIWHFYLGTTLKLHMISPEGNYSFVMIGNNFKENEVPQFIVPAQYYFAAEVVKKNSYSFVGCTVAPGFDFRDFDMPKSSNLIEKYPDHKSIIERLGYK